jgi:hypothetical protein
LDAVLDGAAFAETFWAGNAAGFASPTMLVAAMAGVFKICESGGVRQHFCDFFVGKIGNFGLAVRWQAFDDVLYISAHVYLLFLPLAALVFAFLVSAPLRRNKCWSRRLYVPT